MGWVYLAIAPTASIDVGLRELEYADYERSEDKVFLHELLAMDRTFRETSTNEWLFAKTHNALMLMDYIGFDGSGAVTESQVREEWSFGDYSVLAYYLRLEDSANEIQEDRKNGLPWLDRAIVYAESALESSDRVHDARSRALQSLGTDPPHRDWRILLAGVSFGFLFLASGAGLLKESRQKMATYFRHTRRCDLVDFCLLALRVAQLGSGDGGKQHLHARKLAVDEVLRQTQSRLIEFESNNIEEEPNSDKGEKSPVDKILELGRLAKG